MIATAGPGDVAVVVVVWLACAVLAVVARRAVRAERPATGVVMAWTEDGGWNERSEG